MPMLDNHYMLHHFSPERVDVPSGVLSRQSMIVSDGVSVKDVVTGIGIPAWSDGNEPAKFDAKVVKILLMSGCKLIGKGQVDDFGASISGQNPFLATLGNPVVRGARLGGSSSGIAVAVAKKKATIGIGNDCCGGVLIPASLCNLIGYRPSAGMIDLRGIAPLSPSFDSVGIMGRKLPTVKQIAEKCWAKPPKATRFKGIKYASTLFQELLPIEAMLEWEVAMSNNSVPRKDISNFSKLILTQAHNIHTTILGREIELEYGQWLDHYKPKLTDETQEFLKRIRGKSFKEFVETKKKREIFTETLRGLFSSGELLMIPTTPGHAPQLGDVDDIYLLNQRRLYSIAEVAGLAQLTLPVVSVNGSPMGVSLLALPGEDRILFEAAARWFM
ncbi:hypothetical protein LRP49_16600 [Enterovibrio sp. ZSDZ35]|uniref:Amidase domain-containing protein n=1 Tax=Enterovibrio qingdaonensis TaxID=2899818 RepID=A0ABT5QP90_9GAMM|nr:amidase family protein [Enterovibrio sp. ZSDZ35]MDD1782795.1 hypothetical protein [Enterovibrio sp. ZSDZ35]